MKFNRIAAIVVVLASTLMAGCVGVAVESAHISSDTLIRNNHTQAALAGDAEAQYKVGTSYCCAPRNDADAFYNNQKATEFLCQAARQNHAKAAYDLGKIHSGNTIDGIRLLRRAATLVRDENLDNEVIAYYWFNQAALNGSAEATEALNKLGKKDISQWTDPMTTPCTIDEVYGAG